MFPDKTFYLKMPKYFLSLVKSMDAIWRAVLQSSIWKPFWEHLDKFVILATAFGIIFSLIAWLLSHSGANIGENQKAFQTESTRVTQDKIWDINLIDQTKFGYFTYANDIPNVTQDTHVKPKIIVKKEAKGLTIELPQNTTLELTRPIKIPSSNLGHVSLYMDIGVSSSKPTEPLLVHLLIDARDPILLDSFVMNSSVLKKYNLSSLAGVDTKLLIKVQSNKESGLILSLANLAIRSEPKGGSIIIQAIRQWDGKLLDGTLDDFYFRIEKVDNGNAIFLQNVKMSENGYTVINNLQPGLYMIKGVFNSIVLADIGEVKISDVTGILKKFRCPQSRYIQIKVLRHKGASPIKGAYLIVETNRPEGGPIRGCFKPECRIMTDENGVADLWLFPALKPDNDYYVIRVFKDYNEIGRTEYHLGRSVVYDRHINIFTDLNLAVEKEEHH